jgi:hypothetical protein
MNVSSPKLSDITNITTKGDIAVSALGYAAGFLLYGVVFGLSDPSPTTVAIVSAIAFLAVKNGIEAVLGEKPVPVSDKISKEALRKKRISFENLFVEGRRLQEAGNVKQLIIGSKVHLESQWILNPNYDPGDSDPRHEPQYMEHKIWEDPRERVLALRTLWEAELVTDEYVETYLAELSVLCSRRAPVEVASEEHLLPTDEDLPFQRALMKLLDARKMSYRKLAESSGIPERVVYQLVDDELEPSMSMIRRLAAALEANPGELFTDPDET